MGPSLHSPLVVARQSVATTDSFTFFAFSSLVSVLFFRALALRGKFSGDTLARETEDLSATVPRETGIWEIYPSSSFCKEQEEEMNEEEENGR